jgi:hypothetical protein
LYLGLLPLDGQSIPNLEKPYLSCRLSTTNEEFDHDCKAKKRIDMSIIHNSQNASIHLIRRKQIHLNIADQMREDQNEQEDKKGHADKAVVISKLPPESESKIF